MKKFKFFFSFIVLFGGIQAQTPVEKMGQLQVINTQLSDQNGKPVVLGGVSFGWSNWHGRFYTEDAVKWLKKDWNVNVVRAAMGVEPEDGFLKNPGENLKKVEAVIKGAIDAGIYVIIDWHAHDIHTDAAKFFFAHMSKLYGHYPNIIYEIFNEPDKETWPEVKKYAEEVIAVIRQNDPVNIILVGNPEWDQRVDLVQADPIQNQTNIMYTMHFYSGTHRQFLRDRVDAALAAGIPIFISESGVSEASGDGKPDYQEMEIYLEWMKKNKLSWVAWSISDKKEICSMLLPSASSNGNWKTSQLNESGKRIREYLKQFNASIN